MLFRFTPPPTPHPPEKSFLKSCPIDYVDQDDGSDHMTATLKLTRMTDLLFNTFNLTHQKFATRDGDVRTRRLPGSDVSVAL